MKLQEKMFWLRLLRQTNPSLVRRHLKQKRIKRSGNCDSIDRRTIKAGAVQIEAGLYSNPLEYADEMCRFSGHAAAEGVQLLVFPENNSFQLLGMVPNITAISENLIGDDSPGRTAHLFRFAGPLINRTALPVFSFLAKAHGIYIMAGSFPSNIGGKVMNRAYLFGPDGKKIGRQDKVHLMPAEHRWGLTCGRSFDVFPTPLGCLAMPVCMDASYFETFRLLESHGAEIVMVPIANPEPCYNFWTALRGIWSRVQESTVYGIKSALIGKMLGFTLTGKAGVYAPLELSPERDGVLSEAPCSGSGALVTAVLDLEALQKLKKNHPYLGDKNPAFTRKYFPSIYSDNRI